MSTMHSKHFRNAARAAEYFATLGFSELEVPWAVPLPINRITAPSDACVIPFVDNLTLVGSAEQSLLSLIESGELCTPGKYQAITPCFRNEAVVDVLHQKYFLKTELMIFLPEHAQEALQQLLKDCLAYVRTCAPRQDVSLAYDASRSEYDINVNGIEVGSYGIRYHRNYSWVYGTAHAEPRMSIAIASKR